MKGELDRKALDTSAQLKAQINTPDGDVKLLLQRIEIGVDQSLFRMCHATTSTECRGGNLNAYLASTYNSSR